MMQITRVTPAAVVLMAAWLASGWSRADQQTTVPLALKPDVVVTARQVTLADVAVVGAADPQLKNTLEALRIARAPRIGYAERLTRLELDQLIRTRLAAAGVKTQWSGAQAVRLQSSGRMVDTRPLVETARSYLLKELGTRFQMVDIELASPVADLELPAGALAFKARTMDLKHVYPRMPVWVDIHVDQTAYRSVLVTFIVKGSQPVYVARRDLPEGSVVADGDVELRNEDISVVPNDPVASVDLGGSVRTKKPLSSGQIVTRSHLSQPGMIMRGDLVRLVLAHGGVVIETLAMAQQDAAIGQALRVRAENSIDAVAARVVSAGVVRAEGGQ